MKRTSKKSWNLQKKLAVAMSLVNALNTTAPVALPYVNVARDMKAPGGQVQGLTDAFAAHLYSTAQAATTQTIPDGDIKSATWTENGGTMVLGDTQTINSGGTGTVATMERGEQHVNNGGTGTVVTISAGA